MAADETVAEAAAADEAVIGALLLQSAELLYANGQTTARIAGAVARLGAALGVEASVYPLWGEMILRLQGRAGGQVLFSPARPVGVHMGRVAATMGAIDDFCAAPGGAAALRARLEEIAKLPPASLPRFALMAGAGAAALGVIFGAQHPVTLILIALSAGLGGVLRRGLGAFSDNLFVQPFCAALLAGIIGAIAVRLQLSSAARLIAVCPCMVLVPGPHLLNAMLDLTRGRIPLGLARLVYAGLIILLICAGLLGGLALGGTSLPVTSAGHPVALVFDVLAAGIAVAAFGSFFSMSWRTLPIPMLMGMLAHASRWAMITLFSASVEGGAFVACLIVGICAAPITVRLRLPFAAFAFASVVSLMPGVYLFRMAGGLVGLVTLGTGAPLSVLLATIADGTTAFLILLAMAFGLIVPKLVMDRLGTR